MQLLDRKVDTYLREWENPLSSPSFWNVSLQIIKAKLIDDLRFNELFTIYLNCTIDQIVNQSYLVNRPIVNFLQSSINRTP